MVLPGSSVIEFSGHDHRLYLCDQRTILPLPCSWCGARSNNPPNFRSRDCNYKLDLYCGPLPVMIQKEVNGKDLTLVLMDSLVPGDDQEDLWCDICEEQRDPEVCVYHSPDPHFTATVDCLWPEIKLALEGGLGEVELRTVRRRQIPGKVIVQQPVEEKGEYQQKSSEEERGEDQQKSSEQVQTKSMNENVKTTWTREEILELLSVDERKLIENLKVMQSEEHEDLGKVEDPAAIYTKEALEQFKRQLHITTPVDTSVLFEQRRELEFSKVGDGNIVPSRHIALYRKLVERYGNFSADSELTPWSKALFFALFFEVIDRMRTIQVFNAARYDHLHKWRNTLKCVRDVAGFKIQFAMDNFDNELVRGCFGFKVRDFEADRNWQLQKLSEEIHEEEAKLEELRAQQAHYRRLKENEKSLLKQCLKEAFRCKWRKVGELIQD